MTSPLLTVAQYAARGDTGCAELVEGRLLASPGTLADHNFACGNLITQLAAQLPAHLEVVYSPDVDLELAPPDRPGFVRRPDVVVFRRGTRTQLVRASDVVLAVEVLSPDSHYTDRQAKRLDYAQAGIPHYWIVDLGKPVSLTALRLDEERAFHEVAAADGIYEPLRLEVRLDQLTG